MPKKILIVFGLASLLFIPSCQQEFDTADNICGQEPCYEGPFEAPWIAGHDYGLEFIDQHQVSLRYDNRVLETEHILTFSDASSDEVKIEYARMAEVSLREVMSLFNIQADAHLGIVDLYSKLRIYSNRDRTHAQSALMTGFILYGLDSPYWGNRPQTEPDFFDWYGRMVKHETTHVVQFKLGGLPWKTWNWFTEGLAEYACGGVSDFISCWPQVVEWRLDPNHVNPIGVESLDQIQYNTWAEHYPLFGLAVRYLLDPNGRNRSIKDVKAMFADIGEGMDFEEAFELHMGLTLEYYEAHFWEWMEAFLPPNCD